MRDDNTIIIGVHGLMNKNKDEIISKWWEAAILEGLHKNCGIDININLKMLYWADILHKYPLHNDARYYFDELYNDEPYRNNLNQFFEPYSNSLHNKLKLAYQSIVRMTLDITQHYERLSFWTTHKVFRDLAYYYNKKTFILDRDGQKKNLRKILMGKLIQELKNHRDKKIMIIGHSMGAIICYDVLRNIRSFIPNIEIEQFITIGAPLSYAIVRKHQFLSLKDGHHRSKLRTPSAVKSWFNFSDPTDLACYRTHLKPFYEPNHSGIEVMDQLVNNQYKVYNKKLNKVIKNTHNPFGYLRCPEVSEKIRQYLGETLPNYKNTSQ